MSGNCPVTFISSIYSSDERSPKTYHTNSPSFAVLLDSGLKSDKSKGDDCGSNEEIDDLLLRNKSASDDEPFSHSFD